MLRLGADGWNRWRAENPGLKPDLSSLDFGAIQELGPVPDLSWFNLDGADLRSASIRNAITGNASFEAAYMVAADLCFAHFGKCNFRGAKLRLSRLGSAEFGSCDFTGADLAYCTAQDTKFPRSKLNCVDLQHMQLVGTSFRGASLRGALVYGISAWDLDLRGARQADLVITQVDAPAITVDDLEIAQFIYLLLHNHRLRNVLHTITSKVVLILGRFTPERKAVLDALRNALRDHDLVPVLFDFERPSSRTFIETASTLAHMARFVVADFTDQGDVRREVHHIAANLRSVPIVPLLETTEGDVPITLQDLANDPCVLPIVRYRGIEDLLTHLTAAVIQPALTKESSLRHPRSVG